MAEIVEVKLWHFMLLMFLATYGLFKLVIIPLVQKLIYRRFQATEVKLEEELDFGLPTYALASRRLWIDRLRNDQEVQKVIAETIKEEGLSDPAVRKRALKYANEIVPSFNAFLYFRLGYWITKFSLRLLYWVRVGYETERNYDQIMKNDSVVLVSNHRSNFDPLLLMHLTSHRAPLSYSAGEWALIFPFRQILHTFGFYIISRKRSGNKLYHCILRRYVFLATSQCVPQGLFLEGGLSRDGRMCSLKLGLMSYLMRANNEGTCKDILFVPAALNYDRIPEFKSLIVHQDKGFKNKGAFYSFYSFIRFIATVSTYVLPRRHKPYGYSCVNFGKAVSLNDWQKENNINFNDLSASARREMIGKFGQELAERIDKIVPILPTNILGRVFKESTDFPLSEIELKTRSIELVKKLKRKNVAVFMPKNDEDYALSQGIYILIREKIIYPMGDGRFKLVSGSEKALDYYSNVVPERAILLSSL